MSVLYKVTKKGETKPYRYSSFCGPYYKGAPAEKHMYVAIANEYRYQHAFSIFLECSAMFECHKNVQLWLGKDLIAESFWNPEPKDDYDLYRIRITGKASKELREYIIEEINKGRGFLPKY